MHDDFSNIPTNFFFLIQITFPILCFYYLFIYFTTGKSFRDSAYSEVFLLVPEFGSTSLFWLILMSPDNADDVPDSDMGDILLKQCQAAIILPIIVA